MFNNEHIYLSIIEDKNANIIQLAGSIKQPLLYSSMVVFAANPIGKMISHSGSGFPFPNNRIAFEDSPNYFNVDASGVIQTVFNRPNSYYAADTFTRVVPSIFVKLTPLNQLDEPILIQVELEDTLPLKGRKEKVGGPDFYAKKSEIIGVRSQYDIIRMLEYVKKTYNTA